jgi:ABC-2 type transport system ATP-binding protein
MIVSVERLSKNFGSFKALDEVRFELEAGEIGGLVGPNGAGKTTIIHILLGLISPTAGAVKLFGNDLASDRARILQRLNFSSPNMALPPRLTVLENLTVFARIYNIKSPKRRIAELLERFGVTHLKDIAVSRLSSGETTRVMLCKAFLNDPELLLLDEPTAYLDLGAAEEARKILLELQGRNRTTILYTSHDMREAQRICDRIIFLDHGRVIANGTPIEVTRKILRENRDEAALDEAFIRVARRQIVEAASN